MGTVVSSQPLLDSFGRRHTYLRVSVTDRCNLRCVYCMPAEGIVRKERAAILNFAEITRLAALFARMGVTKVRLTGGEPLLRRDLPRLVGALAATPGLTTVALTTNGVLLKDDARALKAAGLGRLNVSLDTLRPERFARIALRADFERVRAGIDAALEAGFAPLRLNVVVMGGINDDELPDFVAFVRDKPIQVRFIEYMPFKANQWGAARFVPYVAMRRAIERRHALIPSPGSNESGRIAKEFRIEGFTGGVGFITSMSDHFCQACNRLRLTADGALKNCLFSRPELSLRDALRSGASDEALMDEIRRAVAGKSLAHPPMAELAELENQSMIEIGG